MKNEDSKKIKNTFSSLFYAFDKNTHNSSRVIQFLQKLKSILVLVFFPNSNSHHFQVRFHSLQIHIQIQTQVHFHWYFQILKYLGPRCFFYYSKKKKKEKRTFCWGSSKDSGVWLSVGSSLKISNFGSFSFSSFGKIVNVLLKSYLFQ